MIDRNNFVSYNQLTMNNKNNAKLTNNAQFLRRKMTKEERHLWYDFLKTLPITVHRQKVLGRYIVDFYCAPAKLVIELDGSQHYEENGVARDKARDRFLKEQGLTVVRYSNDDINRRFKAVCRDIWNRLKIGESNEPSL